MNLNRRGFLGGLIGALVAPAIVRIDSIMPVRQVIFTSRNLHSLLTVEMITKEAIEIFANSNAFVKNINAQYDEEFAIEGAKIGSTLRIKLPNDYKVTS